jgi:type 1 glutamine amidotransferase
MTASQVISLVVFPLVVALTSNPQQQQPPAGTGRGAGTEQAAPAGGRRGPRDPVAGQPRINALLVSGGCCHDYPLHARLLMAAVSRALPVDWTVAVQGGRGTRGSMPVYARPGWSQGFDIVIHNECLADVDDPEYIRRITTGHRNGPPAVVVHCAMHSYRAATIDDWREFLGVTSRRHTKPFPIPVKIAAAEHPAMKGFKADWVTPVDELYVIDKVWPNTTPLATAVSPEDKQEYALAWAGTYAGTRVFGTTLGHADETWTDPVFQDLLTRGIKWALGRE